MVITLLHTLTMRSFLYYVPDLISFPSHSRISYANAGDPPDRAMILIASYHLSILLSNRVTPPTTFFYLLSTGRRCYVDFNYPNLITISDAFIYFLLRLAPVCSSISNYPYCSEYSSSVAAIEKKKTSVNRHFLLRLL